MVHSAQGRSVPTELEADYLDTIVRLCSAMSALKAENAALRRDLVKALKPRNLKPLRESYARLLHGPRRSDTKRDCANAIAEIMVQK